MTRIPRSGPGGREYDRVYIDADIATSLSRPEALLASAFGDEANIAYVGFTRAIREIHLPPACPAIASATAGVQNHSHHPMANGYQAL